MVRISSSRFEVQSVKLVARTQHTGDQRLLVVNVPGNAWGYLSSFQGVSQDYIRRHVFSDSLSRTSISAALEECLLSSQPAAQTAHSKLRQTWQRAVVRGSCRHDKPTAAVVDSTSMWVVQVMPWQSLDWLASLYGTSPEQLQRMNGFSRLTSTGTSTAFSGGTSKTQLWTMPEWVRVPTQATAATFPLQGISNTSHGNANAGARQLLSANNEGLLSVDSESKEGHSRSASFRHSGSEIVAWLREAQESGSSQAGARPGAFEHVEDDVLNDKHHLDEAENVPQQSDQAADYMDYLDSYDLSISDYAYAKEELDTAFSNYRNSGPDDRRRPGGDGWGWMPNAPALCADTCGPTFTHNSMCDDGTSNADSSKAEDFQSGSSPCDVVCMQHRPKDHQVQQWLLMMRLHAPSWALFFL